MDFGSVHHRLLIGAGHTNVERSDHFDADRILSGDIDSRLQFDMVDSKTCDFFHSIYLFSCFTIAQAGRPDKAKFPVDRKMGI